jgi:dTMP kinase
VNTRKHLFIAFEGGEGAGKSTQIEAIAAALAESGQEIVVTQEPGGTAIGTEIRRMLLDSANTDLSPRAEALLYAADRAQHLAAVVMPALLRGAIVITDRYVDSSLAYQGAGRALMPHHVAALSEFATDGVQPDLTILLDIDPAVGLSRSGRTDRLEAEPLAFHQRVRTEFLALAAAEPHRYAVVAADQPLEDVTQQIAAALQDRVAELAGLKEEHR